MTNQMILIIMNSVVIAAGLLSVVFALGVVWRVEQELDISFKLFSCSIIIFTIGEIIQLFHFEGRFPMDFLALFFKLLFAIFFLMGILAMRDLLRRMDGEKNPDSVFEDVYKRNDPNKTD